MCPGDVPGNIGSEFYMILKMADNVFCTTMSGKMDSLHFLLDLDPEQCTLHQCTIVYFLLEKLRVVLYTNCSCVFSTGKIEGCILH